MTRFTWPGAALAAALGLAGWACPGRAPAPAAVACAPVAGELAAGARTDALAGAFRLTLVADRGPFTGRSVEGTLRLQPFGARPVPVPAAAGFRYPLFGGTDVDLAAVGAVAPGAVDRADAARPGVLVLESVPGGPAGRNSVMLRLGADANRGGDPRFDGAFTALTVTAIDAGRFAGRWQSGGGDQQASGYFCAERIGAAR
ncbi:MAG TPA: hypothetical protein VEQ60_21805 [Longimicrobium sp.]|nr:hypothetical protein [Longimicrobium sp.]